MLFVRAMQSLIIMMRCRMTMTYCLFGLPRCDGIRKAMATRVVIVIRHLSWVVIAVSSNAPTRHTLRGCSRSLGSARKGENAPDLNPSCME